MRDNDDQIVDKEYENEVLRVLHRLISEECTKLVTVSGKISLLNYQAQSFKNMHEHIQGAVLLDIFTLMKEHGWNDWADKLEEKINSQNAKDN